MSIKNGQIRWAFDLFNWRPTLAELQLATACIQLEEKERLSKFVFRDDFDASIIGRLLMRRFIKICLPEIGYNGIQLERDERGKPYLKNSTSKKIAFNVSHHEKYTVLAGTISDEPSTGESSIGVDVMKLAYSGGKSLDEFFRLMHRTFTANEWNHINAQSNEKRRVDAFMRHWCLKESYVKNIGVGITINLQHLDFHVTGNGLVKNDLRRDAEIFVKNVKQEDWTFEESLLDGDYCVAVALNNVPKDYHDIPTDSLLFEIIDFRSLMDGALPLLDIDTEYSKNILAKQYKRQHSSKH